MVVVLLSGEAHDGRDAHRALAGRDRAAGGLAARVGAPRLLESSRGGTGAVLGGHGGPEGRAVTGVDGLETAQVDVAGVVVLVLTVAQRRVGGVEAQGLLLLEDGRGRGGSSSRLGTGRGQRREGDSPRLLDRGEAAARGLDGRGAGQDGGQVDVVGGGEALEAVLGGAGSAGDGALRGRRGKGVDVVVPGQAAGHGRAGEVALAAVAVDLVVVQAAGQVRLVEVGGNVLVGHLLLPLLDEEGLLLSLSVGVLCCMVGRVAYLGDTPGAATAGGL